jgi:hypothetical protein
VALGAAVRSKSAHGKFGFGAMNAAGRSNTGRIAPEEGAYVDENDSQRRRFAAASEPILLSCERKSRGKIRSFGQSDRTIKITWRRSRVRGTVRTSNSVGFFSIPEMFRAGKWMGKVAEEKQILGPVS